MVNIKPFRGLRPRPDLTHCIAAKPYDVLNSDEARIEVAKEPLSFLNISRPEVHFPPMSVFTMMRFIRREGKFSYLILKKDILSEMSNLVCTSIRRSCMAADKPDWWQAHPLMIISTTSSESMN
jgi:uncharacterized protein (DUF1015 family)